MASSDLDLLRGTLDLMALKALSWGPLHGLGVLRWIEQASSDRLQITEGALYPALHRMEERGWLDSEWAITEKNREAKFYKLTPAGRRALADQLSRWHRYSETVGLVLAFRGA